MNRVRNRRHRAVPPTRATEIQLIVDTRHRLDIFLYVPSNNALLVLGSPPLTIVPSWRVLS